MFYDNHIFIHNLRLDDNYRRWSISKSWTLDTSRCSVVAREICITFMTCIWILIAFVTLSNTRWKSAIFVFVFWNLICRNTLPVLQKRLCFPWIIIWTPSRLDYSLFETDLVERGSPLLSCCIPSGSPMHVGF